MYKIITVISFLFLLVFALLPQDVSAGEFVRDSFEYEDYTIFYSFDGRVDEMIIDKEDKSLIIKLTSYKKLGYLFIDLPRGFIDAKSGASDVNFTLQKDGQPFAKRCYDFTKKCVGAFMSAWRETDSDSPDIRDLMIIVDTNVREIRITGTHMLSSSVSESVLEPIPEIPEWVRNIFIWYGEKKISEGELLNAIQFLLDHGILKSKS